MKKIDNKDIIKAEEGVVEIDDQYVNGFIDSVYDLLKKINSYSTWGTNISLGLLGFYLAVLLQYKSAGVIPFKLFSIIVLAIIVVCLIIGFVIYINFEFKDWIKRLFELLKKTIVIFSSVAKLNTDAGKLAVKINEIINEINTEAQNFIYKPVAKLIIVQFGFVILSIGLITFDLIRYLFFVQ
jgi:TRAP-type C4-dicarboxylate transport system permease large subunit